ncbi:hypothetical protein TNCV_1963531 [Trichonephila clavipes]|nr:hypothetical protein TNCV_1963531 [Trichonephila clavipes]
MRISCTQWLHKQLHKRQGPYAVIEYKQATSDFLGASRHAYGHQNIARITRTRLKRLHFTTHIFSSVIRRTSLVYYGLSRKAEVMATLLTVHIAANVFVPY